MKRFFVASTLLLSLSVVAQTPSTEDLAQMANAAIEAERMTADPTLRSGARSTTPGVTFEFSQDEKNATAQVGGGMGSNNRWGLTVSGPVSKNSAPKFLATQEALKTGTTAEILFRRVFLSAKVPLTPLEFDDICSHFIRPELRVKTDPNQATEHVDCSRPDLTDEGKRRLDAKAFPAEWTLGGSFKTGRSSFDYTDATKFVDSSITHSGSSLSLSAGRFQTGSLAARLYYIGVSARHESAYQGGDPKNICTPISGSTSTVCREIAIGAPARTSKTLLQLEARSFIGDNIGLVPRVTLETKTNVWSAELPIYLRMGDSPFNGGVNLAYDSKKHDVIVSLFVGALSSVIR